MRSEVIKNTTGKDAHNEIYVNINGYAAYDKVDTKYLSDRLKVFLPSINLRYTTVNQAPFLKGINAHYHVMSEKDYKSL